VIPIGYGKVILLGEHFVVYGLPAIVTALDLVTTADLEQHEGMDLVIIDQRLKVPSYKPLKTVEYHNMMRALFIKMGVAPYGWRITLHGTLPVSNGGIGASAAAAVAVARAINHHFALNYSDEQINTAALHGEQEVHGTPSGIDNTAATFGGTFAFIKGHAHRNIQLPTPLHLVLADSGRATNTKQILASLSAWHAQNATAITHIFQQYHELFAAAHAALANGNLKALGCAMTQNHTLLAELGASSPELDFLVNRALNAGALGAKLTGTGCGGLMVALASTPQEQNIIAQELSRAEFYTMQTSIRPMPDQQQISPIINSNDTVRLKTW
jgi:mevalonate kinase